jgi:cation transporter-like permease
MNKTVRNERRKLTASWFNAIATAIMAAGVFAPVASQIYGFGSNRVDQTLVLISSIVCVVVSLGLHLVGRQFLGALEE